VVIVVCYTGFVYYYVVGYVIVGCFKVFSCFITVYEICLIVLFYSLLAAYCFSCDNFVIAVPDYGLVSLAVVGVFYSFLMASRAFSIYTYCARISSALSIISLSSRGSTDMVTVFVNAVFFPDVFYGYLIFTGIYLLEDGISLLRSVLLGSITPVI
jgi:hypothetical protein